MSVTCDRTERTVVIVQSYPLRPCIRIANAARALGYVPIIITDAKAPLHYARRENITCITLEDWSTESLRRTIGEIGATRAIHGLLSPAGLFTASGLLGAQVSEIAKDLGLPHTPAESIWLTTNKQLMREAIDRSGIGNIRHHYVVDDESLAAACNYVRFPLILKPVCGLGSSFIYKCESFEEAQSSLRHFRQNVADGYYAHALRDHVVTFRGEERRYHSRVELLAEEYLPGAEMSVEMLCTASQSIPLLLHDKVAVEELPYRVHEHLSVTPPARVPAHVADEIKAYAAAAVDAVGLKSCFCHVELRLDAMGRPRILEINPRIGGASIIQSLAAMRGISYERAIVQLCVGAPVDVSGCKMPEGVVAGVMTMFSPRSGRLRRLAGIEEASKIMGVEVLRVGYNEGDLVGGSFEETFVVDVFIKGPSLESVLQTDRKVRDAITIDVESPQGPALAT